MNAVKATYIVTMAIGQMAMLAGAMLAPVYLTPGNYWWTVLLLFFVCMDGFVLGKRMDLWTGEV